MNHGRRQVSYAAAVMLFIVLASVARPGSGIAADPEDPYRYLDPPPGELGDPASSTTDVVLTSGRIPAVDATTGESPAQAEISAAAGTFIAPAGASQFTLVIQPVEPSVPAPDGSHFVGNAYRFSFTAADGRPVKTAASRKATVTLRGIPIDVAGTLNRLDGTAWRPLHTEPADGTRRSVAVRVLGTFVLMAPGPVPIPTPVPSPSSGALPTTAPTAPPPIPTPTAGVSAAPTASPEPSPTEPPVVVAPAGPASDQGLMAAAVAGTAAVAIGAGLLLLWRRRRAGKQDWRTYR